ncbi:MAG: hypothetical protein JSV03_01705, partial [Planctomycetota bacterium]
GLGMLMVAATFPVGLDQARIVAEETIAPLVANEAFTTLQMLLDDPNPMTRIGDQLPDPTAAPYTFRGALSDNFVLQPNQPLTNELLTGGANPLLINDWLSAPLDDGSGTLELGAHTRYYPSIPGTFAGPNPPPNPLLYTWTIPQRINGNIEDTEPSYTWSVLLRKFNLTGGGIGAQFVVFVNRRSWATPVRNDNPLTVSGERGTYIDVSSATIGGQPIESNTFSEDGFIVREDGIIFRINSIDTTTYPGQTWLILNRNAFVNPNPPPPPPPYSETHFFWFIPNDPNANRSPCIAVYSRTFPLN